LVEKGGGVLNLKGEKTKKKKSSPLWKESMIIFRKQKPPHKKSYMRGRCIFRRMESQEGNHLGSRLSKEKKLKVGIG